MYETSTTDTFTDAQGRHFIAGTEVPAHVWVRFEELKRDVRDEMDREIDGWAAPEGDRFRALAHLGTILGSANEYALDHDKAIEAGDGVELRLSSSNLREQLVALAGVAKAVVEKGDHAEWWNA